MKLVVLFLFLAEGAAFSSKPVLSGATSKLSPLYVAAFGGGSSKIPSSPSARDNQAIKAIKSAISSPKSKSFPLIECEFPPLQALNKLGDGSLRSALEVEDANLSFCSKLVKAVAPLPFLGPKTWLLTSTAASASFVNKAKKKLSGTTVCSLKDGLPDGVKADDLCVVVTPSNSNDYQASRRIADSGITTILVNGFAKDAKSVPAQATMAYFEKPLTYNSQVVGYLIRSFPGDWLTIEVASNKVLGSASDSEILVRGTNTPDLRPSGRLVQKAVDDRAIAQRKANRGK